MAPRAPSQLLTPSGVRGVQHESPTPGWPDSWTSIADRPPRWEGAVSAPALLCRGPASQGPSQTALWPLPQTLQGSLVLHAPTPPVLHSLRPHKSFIVP